MQASQGRLWNEEVIGVAFEVPPNSAVQCAAAHDAKGLLEEAQVQVWEPIERRHQLRHTTEQARSIKAVYETSLGPEMPDQPSPHRRLPHTDVGVPCIPEPSRMDREAVGHAVDSHGLSTPFRVS